MFLTLTHSSEYSVLFVASLRLHHKHFWPFLSFSGVTVLLTLMLLTLEPMTTVILSITSTNISLFPPWKTHTQTRWSEARTWKVLFFSRKFSVQLGPDYLLKSDSQFQTSKPACKTEQMAQSSHKNGPNWTFTNSYLGERRLPHPRL